MILYEEALNILNRESAEIFNTEKVDLEEANGRILAKDVKSDTDFPSFNKSAMDGYAIKKEDISKELKVLEFIPAGKKAEFKVSKTCCSQIMTGAMIPEGADMVVMQEDISRDGDKIVINNQNSRANILWQAEDLKKGEIVIEKGTLLNAVHIGLMASVGCVNPIVKKKPQISIISTGSELVEPEVVPVAPQIRNSNSSQLMALAKESGAEVRNSGTVIDDADVIYNKIKDVLSKSDIVVLTGGASVGEHDFTARVFDRLKAEVKFTKLAIQPGKPVLFAKVEDKFLFGLSGNPVSSFVQFQLLVKPLINKLLKNNMKANQLLLPLAADMKRRKSERQLFFPVIINDNMEAEAVEYHGSAHLNSYQEADAMAIFPIGKKELKKGSIINVRPI